MADLFNIKGKNILVTGGSKGIGFGIAEGLAAAGARVLIANRNVQEGEAAAEELRAKGYAVDFYPVDISSMDSIRQLMQHTLSLFGDLDVLVNNAGVVVRKQAIDYTEQDWDMTVDINLKGTFFCSQLAAEHMIKKKRGKIINTSSVMSEMCIQGRSVYSMTKAGITHMTKALATEWSPFGINVNALGPGLTITNLNEQHFKNNPDDLNRLVSGIPIGRPALPVDYVGATIFLASEASDYVTGVTLLVDGGMAFT